MQQKAALDLPPTLPTVAFYSNFFAHDLLAQSALYQKELFHAGSFGWVTVLQAESRGFDTRWRHWNVLMTYSFRPHSGPGVDSASNRNEYQEFSSGVWRRSMSRADNLDTSLWRLSWNLGASTPLETSGFVQACTKIALPLLPKMYVNAISKCLEGKKGNLLEREQK